MATEQETLEEFKEEEEIPRGQVLFDRWFLLFLLSVLLSGIFYNAWGIIELLMLPVRQ